MFLVNLLSFTLDAAPPTLPRAPLWQGIVALAILVSAFSLLAWWLFFSPLPKPVRPPRMTERTQRLYRGLAVLNLFGMVLGSIGGHWDELWHRMYGGFGEDFLWPPHLLLYGALALTALFALGGLLFALRGAGDIRTRFRSAPLIGWLGLLSAYMVASIPSDLLWHEIIGPDLTAWSLPHWLMSLTGTTASLIGVAIALATLPVRPWRPLFPQLQAMEGVALAMLGFITASLFHLGTTEWEWLSGDAPWVILQRPAWTYPVVTLLIGIAMAHVTLYATRRIGAATVVALALLAAQAGWVAYAAAVATPGPFLASHLLVVLPALALDGWYWLRRDRIDAPLTRWGGALLYTGIYFVVAFPYIARFMTIPTLDFTATLVTMSIGLPVALALAWLAMLIGHWLRRVERLPVEPTPYPASVSADMRVRGRA
ncbi:MAG: hypothetical protein DYG89_42560 [Caldilinea sp. CFX5]|nr:hypothetical protein [Caldilinea sp. CFX5]